MKTSFMKSALVSAVLLATGSALQAATLTFNGTLGNQCIISLNTPGVLAMSSSGTVLSSEETGGTPAEIEILSLGSNTLSVNPPVSSIAPTAYNPSGHVLEVKYAGLGGLSAISQTYTSSVQNVALTAIPASILVVNSRVSNSNGFPAGAYELQTVITCS